ncbi:sensor histidine kinase [Luteipulveratus halotolerans]|uniref:sensor histidine kinase n=1 Tax=Luteipulveratus halotolerans TaxID=1631356 RepID=UPI00067FA369|nr:sensor histidine kinase [Luteipulveratus halotolerans]
MRTDRGWRRFYATGWFLTEVATVVAFRRWHQRVTEVENRAAEAERAHEEAARRTAEERVRIARELHDSLTHSISVIKVQAGVARHLAQKNGDPVPPALAAIEEAAGDAARELRQTLSVLRSDEGGSSHGLAAVPRLVDRATAAGVPTDLRTHGRTRALPDEIDRASYRIVQESLTNVARHAGPASATVTITYAADRLTLQVDDDGRGHPGGTPTPGLGLIGMRERASALGGRLVAQGRPDGGFTVRAELPLPEALA